MAYRESRCFRPDYRPSYIEIESNERGKEMKKSCANCKKQPDCNMMAKFSIKGRDLEYVACSDGKWAETNGDRMRKMTNEEIVEQVAEIASWARCCNKAGLVKWLNQEAPDD